MGKSETHSGAIHLDHVLRAALRRIQDGVLNRLSMSTVLTDIRSGQFRGSMNGRKMRTVDAILAHLLNLRLDLPRTPKGFDPVGGVDLIEGGNLEVRI